jgi:hypothetical protein
VECLAFSRGAASECFQTRPHHPHTAFSNHHNALDIKTLLDDALSQRYANNGTSKSLDSVWVNASLSPDTSIPALGHSSGITNNHSLYLTTVWPMCRRFKSWSNTNSGFRIRIAIGMDRAVVTTALRARVLFMSPSSGQSIASLHECRTIAMWRIACRGRVVGWPPSQRQSIRMLTRIPTRIPRHPYWSIIGALAVLLAPWNCL